MVLAPDTVYGQKGLRGRRIGSGGKTQPRSSDLIEIIGKDIERHGDADLSVTVCDLKELFQVNTRTRSVAFSTSFRQLSH